MKNIDEIKWTLSKCKNELREKFHVRSFGIFGFYVRFSSFLLSFVSILFFCVEARSTTGIAGEMGYIDKSGKYVIKPQFNSAHDFQDSRALVVGGKRCHLKGAKSEYFAFIDQTGKIIFESCGGAKSFSDGLAAIAIDYDKWGFINKNGEIAIEPRFDEAEPLSEGLAAVNFKGTTNYNDPDSMFNPDNLFGKWGFIDKKGDMVIKPQFQFSSRFSGGFAKIKSGGVRSPYIYIDKAGRKAIDRSFSNAFDFSDGLALVVPRKGQSEFINRNGQSVIKKFWESHGTSLGFSEGLYGVKIDDHFGFIDQTGKIVIEPRFDEVQPFADGYAAVKLGKKWGFIDKMGNVRVEPQFDGAGPFSEGLAAVNIGGSEDAGDVYGGKWGYIDKTGEIVIVPQFCQARPFSEGLAAVTAFPCKDWDHGVTYEH